MGGGHVSRPDFGMAQPDPAHPLTEFYLLVQQALDKAGCFALPALYASLQAPARRIYPEEAREYLRLAPQAGEGFVRLQAAVQMQVLYSSLQVVADGAPAALLLTGCGASADEASAQLFAMDTVMEVAAYGEHAEQAVKYTEKRIEELENRLSRTKPPRG